MELYVHMFVFISRHIGSWRPRIPSVETGANKRLFQNSAPVVLAANYEDLSSVVDVVRGRLVQLRGESLVNLPQICRCNVYGLLF